MPTMDGWDFLEYLRKEKDWARLPVVVLSAALRRGEPRPVLKAQAFWSKPPLEQDIQNIYRYCEVHRQSGVTGSPVSGLDGSASGAGRSN
jgi:CheY-like chemotaxis protein